MKWMEITVVTSQEAKEAVADVFYRAGANGVVVEDASLPIFADDVEDYSRVSVPDIPLEEVRVTAYLPLLEATPGLVEDIRLAVSALSDFGLDPSPAQVLLSEVAEEDWATAWKQYYHPIVVGSRLVIKPTWDDFIPSGNPAIVELDPGMAFGTGNHATTLMCLEFLHEEDLSGKSVLDMGCGSGILSLAAAKLGAKSVLALDYDPLAVKVARENVCHNNLAEKIEVKESDLFAAATGTYDVVVANIIARVVADLIPSLSQYLAKDGVFLASGIIRDKLELVLSALDKHDFRVRSVSEQGEWVALTAVRRAH